MITPTPTSTRTTDPDLIPAHRFGTLLATSRADLGLDLDTLARNSGGRFTVGELSAFETGRDSVRDDLLPLLSHLYNVDCRQVVPHRAKLCIDLNSNYLRVGETKERLTSSEHQHILDRYLSLVYMLRRVEPGTEIPLRSHDLAILEASLLERSELIEEQLLAAMAANDPALATLLGKLKKRLWVPGAGLLVGAVTMGALVFSTPAETDTPEAPTGAGGGDRAPSTIVVDQPASLSSTSTVQVADDASAASAVSAFVAESAVETPAVEAPAAEAPAVEAPTEAPVEESYVTVSAEQLLGEQALDLIGIDMEQTFPGWTVEFRGAVRGFHGLTFATEKRVEVYVHSDDTPESLAGVVAHELGHVFDLTYLDDTERIEWMDARGVTTQWWVGNGISDFRAGQGDFAEAFAHHFTGDAVHGDSQGPITPAQDQLLEQLLNRHI